MLETLHMLDFVHLDIKPDNILIANCPLRAPHVQATELFKLADFGKATKADGSWEFDEGDRRYCSAELIAGVHSNLRAADVFSLGATVFELASLSEMPHEGPLYDALRTGCVPDVPGYSEAFQTLLKA